MAEIFGVLTLPGKDWKIIYYPGYRMVRWEKPGWALTIPILFYLFNFAGCGGSSDQKAERTFTLNLQVNYPGEISATSSPAQLAPAGVALHAAVKYQEAPAIIPCERFLGVRILHDEKVILDEGEECDSSGRFDDPASQCAPENCNGPCEGECPPEVPPPCTCNSNP